MSSKSYIYSLSLKVTQTLLGLGVSILLARTLGVDEFGLYSLSLAIASIINVLIQVGLPTYLVREISKLRHKKEWELIIFLYSKSRKTLS